MAALGFGEGRRRGSRDSGDDRPRRKRPFSSTLEEEEEEEGWGGGGGPSWYLDKDDRERPPARKARGRPWPDPHEEEEEGRTGGESWGSRWGESGKGSREPPRVRGRSRSPPRGGQGWRGRGSPSPPRERAWRSPASLGQPDRASRTKVPSSSSGSCSSGRKGGRGSPGREEPKRRPWESPPKKITGRKSPQEEEGRQLPPSSRRAVERGHLKRSSSSSTYRSKRSPGWEARQEYTQSQSHRERDHPYQEKAGRSGERQRNHKQRESYTVERYWDSPSRGRRQESPAWGSSEWEKDREASPSYSFQSQFDRDHRRRSWDSPERKGKELEIWSRDDALEMHYSSSEDTEDRDRLTGFEDEWTLSKGQEVIESPQGDLSGPEGRPRIYMGPGKRAVGPVIWVPSDEVVDFWNQCQSIMKKDVRDYLLSTCCRPTLPNKSCVTPELNPSIKALLTEKQVKAYTTSSYYSQIIHAEVLNMLAPVMTIYEMAAESIEKQVPVDPQELREWARRVIRYIGSINMRLQLQRRSSILGAIDPRLKRMAPKMSGPSADGLLFMEDKVKLLKKIIGSFPEQENEPGDINVKNYYSVPRPRDGSPKQGSGKYDASQQDGVTQLPKLDSAQQEKTTEFELDDMASLEVWHRRFAHQDSKLILQLQSQNLTTGFEIEEGEADGTASCAVCLQVKGSRAPSPPRTERRSTQLLDLIHSEIHGPVNVPSLGNNVYVLIFVDDFSRYCLTRLMKEESEIDDSLRKYVGMVQKTFQRKPKAFQMGDRVEQLSRPSQAFLEKQGISYLSSDAQSPEPNQGAKREMRSLLEMMRCMLADAELPDKFWGDAIMMATYLLNRLPADGAARTPYELWHGQVPTVKAIRVFGSLAYAYIPKSERRRLDPKWEETIFLGYAPRFRCYKVMSAESGEVSTRTVDYFDEHGNIKKRGAGLDAPAADGHDADMDPLAGKD